jgi:protein gp37
MAHRLALMGQKKYQGTTRVSGGRAKWTGLVNLDAHALDVPKRWSKGRLIFVNSMSDLFHEAVPFRYIQGVVEVMRETPQHTYQVLTKRAERLEILGSKLEWPSNVWIGVSVESEGYWWRVDHLRRVKAPIRFLSLEPLLGPLKTLDFTNIDWVIAGGESGPRARSLDPDWVRQIRDECLSQRVAFHFKQWGGINKKATGRTLDDRTWDEWPVRLHSHSASVHAPTT